MAKIGRNDPCPCGSGRKFKKCCEAKFEAEARSNRSLQDRPSPSGARVMRSDGPAQRMQDFAQPLLEATDGSREQLEHALRVGMLFWNLAIMQDEGEREKMLDEMTSKVTSDENRRQDFRLIARQMVERHRRMFPELHR